MKEKKEDKRRKEIKKASKKERRNERERKSKKDTKEAQSRFLDKLLSYTSCAALVFPPLPLALFTVRCDYEQQALAQLYSSFTLFLKAIKLFLIA